MTQVRGESLQDDTSFLPGAEATTKTPTAFALVIAKRLIAEGIRCIVKAEWPSDMRSDREFYHTCNGHEALVVKVHKHADPEHVSVDIRMLDGPSKDRVYEHVMTQRLYFLHL